MTKKLSAQCQTQLKLNYFPQDPSSRSPAFGGAGPFGPTRVEIVRIPKANSSRTNHTASVDANQEGKRMKRQLNYMLSLLSVFIFIFFYMKVGQITAASISVSPSKIEITVTEKNNSVPITIKNGGDESSYIRVRVGAATQGLDGGVVYLSSTEGPWCGAKLINLDPTEFVLDAGESKKVTADFKIPEGRSGGAYAAIFFNARPVAKKEANISSALEIAVITMMTFPGPVIKRGEVTGVELGQAKPGEKIKILTLFHNSGNIHFRASGTVTIENQDGEEIARVPIESANTLPGCSRYLKSTWKPENLLVGTYTAKSDVKLENGELLTADTIFSAIRPNEIAQLKGEVADFPAPKGVLNKPITFELLFHNAGNVELFPEGVIEIKDSQGKIITEAKIEKTDIPPGSSNRLNAVLESGLPVGDYTAIARIHNEGRKLAIAETQFKVIEKELIVDGKITEFSLKWENSDQLVIPKLLFKNTGNTSSETEGIIKIKNSQGKVVGQIAIQRTSTAPGETERLGSNWQGNLPPGLYTASVTLILGNDMLSKAQTSFLVAK